MKKIYILCAAIWFNDGKTYVHQPVNIKTGFVVCGQRHHNCFIIFSILKNEDYKRTDYGDLVQGFLTSDNKFVNRKEGGRIAFKANQIVKKTDCLFSEDLY